MSFEDMDYRKAGWETSVFTIDFLLPEDRSEIDKGWCELFTQIHGDGKMRTWVEATSCKRQSLDASGVNSAHKRYVDIDFWLPDGEKKTIDGIVMGMRMVPDFNQRGSYAPHLVLKDMLFDEYDRYRQHPEQEFLVPIGDSDSLTLYKL